MLRERRPIHLSESDLRFVVATVATQRQDHEHVLRVVRDQPDILDHMLADEKLFHKVAEEHEALVRISPSLLFTILIRRSARDLAAERYTMERVGAADKVPVFDARRVADLLHDEAIRDYLVDLLASFVRTESATVWYRSGRHWRRRTYSDLDVDDMISLASQVAEEFRFPFLKRIGDICLFVTGVFPEHVGMGYTLATGLRGVTRRGRQRRSLPEYLEEGRRFYGLAAGHEQARAIGLDRVLVALSDNIELARKPLNLVADRYLRLHKRRLFGEPG